jgi:hypothetical protein
MNPDVEIVSSDNSTGTIVVRDKKTGKSLSPRPPRNHCVLRGSELFLGKNPGALLMKSIRSLLTKSHDRLPRPFAHAPKRLRQRLDQICRHQ